MLAHVRSLRRGLLPVGCLRSTWCHSAAELQAEGGKEIKLFSKHETGRDERRYLPRRILELGWAGLPGGWWEGCGTVRTNRSGLGVTCLGTPHVVVAMGGEDKGSRSTPKSHLSLCCLLASGEGMHTMFTRPGGHVAPPRNPNPFQPDMNDDRSSRAIFFCHGGIVHT